MAFSLLACSDNYKHFNDEKMVNLLVEIHKADGIIKNTKFDFRRHDNIIKKESYYKAIFDKYKITYNDLDSLEKFYSYRLNRYNKIYEKVIEILNKQVTEAEAFKNAKNCLDTLNLWNKSENIEITNLDSLPVKFDIKINRLGRYTITGNISYKNPKDTVKEKKKPLKKNAAELKRKFLKKKKEKNAILITYFWKKDTSKNGVEYKRCTTDISNKTYFSKSIVLNDTSFTNYRGEIYHITNKKHKPKYLLIKKIKVKNFLPDSLEKKSPNVYKKDFLKKKENKKNEKNKKDSKTAKVKVKATEKQIKQAPTKRLDPSIEKKTAVKN